MKTITCKVPDVMAAQLDVLAREEQSSKSAVLRDALAARLEAKIRPGTVSAYDLVKHLCGSVEGGTTDLATNPEHLRGFGE